MGHNQPKVVYVLDETPPLPPSTSSTSASSNASPQSLLRAFRELDGTPATDSDTTSSDNDDKAAAHAWWHRAHAHERDRVVEHFFRTPLTRRLARPFAPFLQLMLPKGYPQSVSSVYTTYTKWSFVQGSLSSCSGVLSMQSLLYAVGLGQPLALPAAAAIQWVLKDGLGQLGGMLFASYVNVSFDSDAKRWRMLAAGALDASTCIEIVTPLMPALFLPLASIANIGKNVSWLSASASRASIHRSLQREENLADITAKAGSQSIAASLVGTGLGITISMFVGANPLSILACFACLSTLHLAATYRSLSCIPLASLNAQRAERVCAHFVTSVGGEGEREQAKVVMLTPHDVARVETFVRPYASPLDQHSRLVMGPSFDRVLRSFAALVVSDAAAAVHVTTRERAQQQAATAVASSHVRVTAVSIEPMNSEQRQQQRSLALVQRLCETFREDAFFVSIEPPSSSSSTYDVQLLYQQHATSQDVLLGYLLAVWLRTRLHERRSGSGSSGDDADLYTLLRTGLTFVRTHRHAFLELIEQRGWTIDHLFVEPDKHVRVRVRVPPTQSSS